MIGKYDFSAVEPEILKFWKDKDTYRKLKDMREGEAIELLIQRAKNVRTSEPNLAAEKVV